MVRLQIVEMPNAKLLKKLVAAMKSGSLKTFVSQKKGSKVIHTNVNYPGWMNWSESHGVIACEIKSPNKPGQEWKLLSSLVGRLADKYSGDIHSVSIQFPETD